MEFMHDNASIHIDSIIENWFDENTFFSGKQTSMHF